MNLTDKLKTLLKATANPARMVSKPSYKAQISDLKRALASVETQERRVAAQLKKLQDKADEAEARRDWAAVKHLQTMMVGLETSLNKHGEQAIALTDRLTVLQESIDASEIAASPQPADRDHLTATEPPRDTTDVSRSVDEDLDARKSRLGA